LLFFILYTCTFRFVHNTFPGYLANSQLPWLYTLVWWNYCQSTIALVSFRNPFVRKSTFINIFSYSELFMIVYKKNLKIFFTFWLNYWTRNTLTRSLLHNTFYHDAFYSIQNSSRILPSNENMWLIVYMFVCSSFTVVNM